MNPTSRKRSEFKNPTREIPGEGPTLVRETNLEQCSLSSSSLAYLLSVLGPSKGQFVEIRSQSPLIIGRSRHADIRIDDETISRKHARILGMDPGRVTILDLDTTNGTFVNDLPVDLQDLNNGDEIRIGESLFQFAINNSETDHGGSTSSRKAIRNLLDKNLSARQLEIAKLVTEGLSNGQIGEALHISPRTVSTHLENIYDRLDISSRVELVIHCAKLGLFLQHQTVKDSNKAEKT